MNNLFAATMSFSSDSSHDSSDEFEDGALQPYMFEPEADLGSNFLNASDAAVDVVPGRTTQDVSSWCVLTH